MMQRLRTFAWMLLIVITASMLYGVKYKVQSIKEEAAILTGHINAEKDAIHVLTAEWTYLNRPERIQKLAAKHLGLVPLQGEQIAEMESLGAAPLVAETMHATPAAAGGGGIIPLDGFLTGNRRETHGR